MSTRGSSKGKISRAEFEAKVDDLEKRLKDKIDVNTGFADPEVKARALERSFKYFDRNGSGTIDYQEFFAAMTKLNFIGCQREIEALFNKYDEDASGTLDYKEFSYYLWGLGNKPTLDVDAKNIVEKVKARIIARGGASGIHGVAKILARMDRDGSKNLDVSEIVEGMEVYGIKMTDSEARTLFSYFDRDGSGRISVDEFLRGLKGGMSYDRKMLVREAFRRFDRTGDGCVTVEDILQCFDTSTHPSVAGGIITPAQAAQEMLSCFEQGGDVNGQVTWAEFLDYYKGLSLAIEDDSYFELMIRNAWHISGGEGTAANSTCRRVLVTHTDGMQEVVELEDDLGLGKFDMDVVIARLQDQGVTNIADVKF